MIDINVVKTDSQDRVVDHSGSRHIVFIERSNPMMFLFNFEKYVLETFVMLCGIEWGKKFSFGIECSSCGLSFRAKRVNIKVQEDSIARCRTATVMVISVSRITKKISWPDLLSLILQASKALEIQSTLWDKTTVVKKRLS